MRPARRPLARVLLATVLVATALVMGGVTPAHAYTCGYDDLVLTVSYPEVMTSFRYEERCSDGLSRVTGTVYDRACDDRQARVTIAVYDTDQGSLGGAKMYEKSARAENGCGTSATFAGSGPSPGTTGWRVRVSQVACSRGGFSCSTSHNDHFYG